MKSSFLCKTSAICFVILFLNSFLYIFAYADESENFTKDPIHDFRNPSKRKCFHFKKENKKSYFASFATRKTEVNYYAEIPFEPMRIHFDYSLTLPHEEKMIKELVMPPVKRFFENALSVRRVLGKLRIPKDMDNCQEIPIPKYLKTEGVNADLIIMVSTYRGLKKFNFENNINEDEFKNVKK